MTWRFAEAKNRFSEVADQALMGTPQVVLLRRDAVGVVSRRDYERLTRQRPSFKQFLLGKGPAFDELDLKRNNSRMRSPSEPNLTQPSQAGGS